MNAHGEGAAKMKRFVKKLLGDERGNVLAIVCACMPLVVGAAGLATDTIQWTLWKRQLQRAADSAAMAGVYTSLTDNTDSAVTAGVRRDLALNLQTRMALATAPTVQRLGTSGAMRNRVLVRLQVQQRLPFSSMFMSSPPMISATATAATVPSGGEYCVIGTDRRATVTGITISGSTNLNMGSCSLIANSAHPTAAASNNTGGTGGGAGSRVTAASLDAAGGVDFSSQWNVSSYNPYSEPLADPFANLVTRIPATSAGCNKTGSLNKTNGSNGNGGNVDYRLTHTASDIVCLSGNQTIQGNVQLGPATYVIDAGSLGMNTTGSSLTCNGCTIVLTNFSNPANTGTVNLTGGSIDLKPPRSSTTAGVTTTIGNQNWKGVVLYQDPRATDDNNFSNSQNKINGNSSTSVQGAVYFGNQSLQYVGGGNTTAACLQVVAKRVVFGGNSLITAGSQCAGFGLSGIGGTRRVRLVA